MSNKQMSNPTPVVLGGISKGADFPLSVLDETGLPRMSLDRNGQQENPRWTEASPIPALTPSLTLVAQGRRQESQKH